jgi:hypothetical protein
MRHSFFVSSPAVLALTCALAGDFETPPQQPASASLPPELVSGPDFHVIEPVESDGLMHHYVIDSRFGQFSAYGQQALKVRVLEIAALTELSKRSDIDVAAKSVEGHVASDAKTVKQLVTNPVGTIAGIPQGVGHLFGGVKAQAGELHERVKADTGDGCGSPTETSNKAGEPESSKPTCRSGSKLAENVKSDATRYADKYLGLSAAERGYYQQLHVDPYTDNPVLRKAVRHLARIEAATNLGMHFAGVPGVPYLSDVRRAMDTLYNEDPAVLRARERKALDQQGLSEPEITRFENTLLLSPTRQLILEQAAQALHGVDGRDEIYRHAMSVTTETEMQVFIESVRLLVRVHARQPIVHVLPGLRLPSGLTRERRIVVAGAFDAVSWTKDVAAYESALHEALPAEIHGLDVWLSGSVSTRALHELAARGWVVHDRAWESLPDAPAPEAAAPALHTGH